jgi:tRNA(Leu) C34 or U34 (ribose-2'-O)-methylase TrmL
MTRFDAAAIERFWRDQNSRRRALRARLDARRLPYAVAVENLSKDANLGNLIRTANAFLCGEILLVGSPVFDPTGAGAVYRFERMRHFEEPAEFLEHAAGAGYTLIAVEIDSRAELLHRFRFPPKPLFLFGSELNGLSRSGRRAADDSPVRPRALPQRQRELQHRAVPLRHDHLPAVEPRAGGGREVHGRPGQRAADLAPPLGGAISGAVWRPGPAALASSRVAKRDSGVAGADRPLWRPRPSP